MRRRAILNEIIGAGIIEEETFEQRLKGSENNRVSMWISGQSTFQAEDAQGQR